MTLIRLNKYLSSQGIASRRAVDAIISQGRITINGTTATLGAKIDPYNDTITIDGKIWEKKVKTQSTYIALNKPTGVVSTSTDPQGRPTVVNLVRIPVRIFPVGRLDIDSTGLILLTDDGQLALKLTHPRYHFPKTYLVTVIGSLTPQKISQMSTGVSLEEGTTAPSDVQIFHKNQASTELKITLYEGKKRQIRRMCAALNLHVSRLHRIKIGPVHLGNLKEGEWRYLTPAEVRKLLQ